MFDNAADATDDPVLLGEEAARILAHPVLALAFKRIDDRLMSAIRDSTTGESDLREQCYRDYRAFVRLKTELKTMVGNAKMAQAERERARGR